MDKCTLYRLTSANRIMEWTIWIDQKDDHCIIFTEHGQKGGKRTKSKGLVIRKGKQGRTILEQAQSQLQSKIKKHKDQGYTQNKKGKTDATHILPMLAKEYVKNGHKIVFPATIQPKLDGVRCVVRVQNGEVHITSRRGKPFVQLNQMSLDNIPNNVLLDGELYSNSLDFQRITGLVRKRKQMTSSDDIRDMAKIKLHIFDLVHLDDLNMSFIERWTYAKTLCDTSEHLVIVPIYNAQNKDDILPLLHQCMEDGYEGIMIRNTKSPYEINKRSFHLQKYKLFQDSEYKIIGAEEGTGNDKGTVIWICSTKDNMTFKVRPRGTREQRAEYFQHYKKFIGSMLTVKYQELTNDKVPRFPVGIAIRNYE